MDARTNDAVTTVLQQELLRNERTVAHPVFGDVKFRRPNPDQERSIASVRGAQFHRDMKDESILSRDELEALAIRRGMWSMTTSARIEELTLKTGEAMGILDAIGFRSIEALMKELGDTKSKLVDLFKDEPEPLNAIERYFDLDLTALDEDRSLMLDNAPSTDVDDLIERADILRKQIKLLLDMKVVRQELSDLHTKTTKLFMDSVEARADRAEELARIYYCTSVVSTGLPLWATYDDIWHAPPTDVKWLIEEMYFYLNGITDEFKGILGRFGFLERLNDTSESSGDSPVQPEPNPDGASPESNPIDSSLPTA